jgi:RimJ/RimL family protein N-acetyltransferase
MANVNLQPTFLKNAILELVPLKPEAFEALYAVASDPLIWEQHPTRNRYQKAIFTTFFEGAIASKGAFLVLDTPTQEPVGSTRFYDFNADDKSIKIGYSFLSRVCWGKNYNRAMKTLMMEYAFEFADRILFEIGGSNLRSQKAIERLGAQKIGEEAIAYFGEQPNTNFIYKLDKVDWENL